MTPVPTPTGTLVDADARNQIHTLADRVDKLDEELAKLQTSVTSVQIEQAKHTGMLEFVVRRFGADPERLNSNPEPKSSPSDLAAESKKADIKLKLALVFLTAVVAAVLVKVFGLTIGIG